MRKRLTEQMIERLKPPTQGRLEIFDDAVPALAVRVTSNGAKSFIVRTRVKGEKRPIRVTLGDARALKLFDARNEASDILRTCRAGDDPREARRAKVEQAARERGNTFGAIAEAFIQQHVSKLRSKSHTEAEIRRYLIAHWGKRPGSLITMDDVAERIRTIVNDGKPHMARLVLAHCKRLFRWASAVGRSREIRLKNNPCLGITAKDFDIANAPRQTVLTNEHLQLIWKAAGILGEPFGMCIRMLILSGQRKSEVAEMTWTELDLDGERVWSIPAERMKAKRPHEVPLSPPMVELLLALREHRGKGPFVFSTSLGRRPVAGFSKAKIALNEIVAKLYEGEGPLPTWRIHDIRRTVRTGLGAIPSIPHDIRELVIAHVPPALVQTYDLHPYREEKRQALELWSERLLSIVESALADASVVELRKRGAQQ